MLLPGEADHVEIFFYPFVPAHFADILRFEGEPDVVFNGQPVQQSRALKDVADARGCVCAVLGNDAHLA
ncbi:hypothetical protein D3C83_75140 [compost metagenome]